MGGGGGGGGRELDMCVQDGRTETERGAGFKMIRICLCVFLPIFLLEYDKITGRFFCSDDYHNSEGFFLCVVLFQV